MAIAGHAFLGVSLLSLLARSLAAQAVVTGTAVDQDTGSPLAGARVTLLSRGETTSTNRFGQFAIWVTAFPDTLVVAFLGREPDTTLVLSSQPSLRIKLKPAAVVLSDIIVEVSPNTVDKSLATLGQWQLTQEALRTLPPAVETDVYRALVLVPGVSFSSVLSARPIVRGYAADESSFKVDGFEIANPFHLGRIFSAFPADAVEQVSVSTAPQSVTTGGTLAGIVDVTGRTGPETGAQGGGSLSLASAGAWLGAKGGPRWFVSGRAVYLSAVDGVVDRVVPYDFQDLYASGLLTVGGDPRGRFTLFGSRDDLFDSDVGSGMDWQNALAGLRWQLVRSGAMSLEASAAGTTFREHVVDLPARHSRIDVYNRFTRIGGSIDLSTHWLHSDLRLGSTVGIRSIVNTVDVRSGSDFPEADVNQSRLELGPYGELTLQRGKMLTQIGARLDLAGGVSIFQPRLRLIRRLSPALSIGLSLGRTSRLHHIVSDPVSEPDLAFYDFWLNAGEDGIPIPVVDHASLDFNVGAKELTARGSLFGSRAHGLVELRPETESQLPGQSSFREGRGWTAGAEVQLSVANRSKARSLTGTYVLSWSQRNWDSEWRPWALERRHQVRFVGQMMAKKHWHLAGAFEYATGLPLTPVDGVAIIGNPDPRTGGVTRDSLAGQPVYVYGSENSARGGGTLRLDLSATYGFRGPWKSHMWAGLSVLNLNFGAVAPLRAADPLLTFDGPTEIPTGTVAYTRTFDVPAVPTVTLRVEF